MSARGAGVTVQGGYQDVAAPATGVTPAQVWLGYRYLPVAATAFQSWQVQGVWGGTGDNIAASAMIIR